MNRANQPWCHPELENDAGDGGVVMTPRDLRIESSALMITRKSLILKQATTGVIRSKVGWVGVKRRIKRDAKEQSVRVRVVTPDRGPNRGVQR